MIKNIKKCVYLMLFFVVITACAQESSRDQAESYAPFYTKNIYVEEIALDDIDMQSNDDEFDFFDDQFEKEMDSPSKSLINDWTLRAVVAYYRCKDAVISISSTTYDYLSDIYWCILTALRLRSNN